MSYLKKGATLLLVFLLLMTIAVFSISVVFFQNSMIRLNDDISSKQDMIDTLNTNLYSLSENHTILKGILDIQLRREANLTEQFLDIKLEKEDLNDEVRSLTRELDYTKENLTLTMAELQRIGIELAALESDYNETLDELSTIKDDVDDICTKASSLNISECSNYG